MGTPFNSFRRCHIEESSPNQHLDAGFQVGGYGYRGILRLNCTLMCFPDMMISFGDNEWVVWCG